jgi:hypothetical protein
MSNEDRSIEFVATLLFVGGGLFYKGLKAFKTRRKMFDIPTSKIDSAVIGGLVEVVGSIVCDEKKILESPLTNKKCAAFYWEIQEYISSKNKGSWRTISEFYSSNYILLNDGGKTNAAIDLEDSNVLENKSKQYFEFKDKSNELPLKVQNLLRGAKKLNFDNSDHGFFAFKNRYRIIEHRFPTDRRVYVIGETFSRDQIKFKKTYLDKVDFKKSYKEEYAAHKQDPKLLKEYDLDGNNKLDKNEVTNMKLAIKHSLLTGFNNGVSDSEIEKAHIFFKKSKTKNRIFDSNQILVSFKSQEDTIKNLTFIAYGGLAAGPIMISVGVYLIFRFFS